MHELESSQNTKNMLFAVFNLLFFNVLLNATCVETLENFALFKVLINPKRSTSYNVFMIS